jgi:hypothetical protein
MNNSTVLRVQENGVEYFTVVATGESGISITGLSQLSEIPRKTLGGWLENLGEGKLVKGLEALLGKDLYLGEEIKKRGGTVKAVKAEYAYEVLEFAAYERGSQVARKVLKACGVIGLNSFIQGKTNWLPNEYQSSHESRDAINCILDAPEPWSQMFEQRFEKNLERISGLHKCDIRNASLYWEFIYHWLTTEERIKLDAINPVLQNGRRKYKIHACIEQATKDRLRSHIQAVLILMESANSVSELRRLLQRREGFDQGDLFDGWGAA